jgi:hypothetical protein
MEKRDGDEIHVGKVVACVSYLIYILCNLVQTSSSVKFNKVGGFHPSGTSALLTRCFQAFLQAHLKALEYTPSFGHPPGF